MFYQIAAKKKISKKCSNIFLEKKSVSGSTQTVLFKGQLYNFIHTILKNRQNNSMVLELKIVVTFWQAKRAMTGIEPQGILSSGCILTLDPVSGDTVCGVCFVTGNIVVIHLGLVPLSVFL